MTPAIPISFPLAYRLEPGQTLFAGYYREVNTSAIAATNSSSSNNRLNYVGRPGCACASTKEWRRDILISLCLPPSPPPPTSCQPPTSCFACYTRLLPHMLPLLYSLSSPIC